jgi:universal stress protein G
MYKKILMPVDVFEMDLSDKAVRHAANLAKAEGASITLVNILPTSSRSLLRGFNADIKKFEEYMTEESGKKMNALKRLFDISPENIDSLVRFGNVRDEIIRLSKEGNMTRSSSGRKTRASPPICWDQMRNLSCATPQFRC